MLTGIEQIEAAFKQHFDMPRDLEPGELRGYASEIQKYLEVNDGFDGLILQLGRIQTNFLQQRLKSSACKAIAAYLLGNRDQVIA